MDTIIVIDELYFLYFFLINEDLGLTVNQQKRNKLLHDSVY